MLLFFVESEPRFLRGGISASGAMVVLRIDLGGGLGGTARDLRQVSYARLLGQESLVLLGGFRFHS